MDAVVEYLAANQITLGALLLGDSSGSLAGALLNILFDNNHPGYIRIGAGTATNVHCFGIGNNPNDIQGSFIGFRSDLGATFRRTFVYQPFRLNIQARTGTTSLQTTDAPVNNVYSSATVTLTDPGNSYQFFFSNPIGSSVGGNVTTSLSRTSILAIKPPSGKKLNGVVDRILNVHRGGAFVETASDGYQEWAWLAPRAGYTRVTASVTIDSLSTPIQQVGSADLAANIVFTMDLGNCWQPGDEVVIVDVDGQCGSANHGFTLAFPANSIVNGASTTTNSPAMSNGVEVVVRFVGWGKGPNFYPVWKVKVS